MNLTHLDDNNRPKMVDVSEKNESRRVAIASGEISMSQEAFDAIISNNTKKAVKIVKIGNFCRQIANKKPAIILLKIMQVIILYKYYWATDASVVIFTVILSPTAGT